MTLFPLVANAQSAVVDGINYEIVPVYNGEDYAKLVNSYSYSGDIVIPTEIVYQNKKYRVRALESGAFSGCDNLRSVVFPSNWTFMGNETFRDCKNLKSVVLPKKLKEIGAYAFAGTNFTSFTIPEGVTVIREGAFSECENLKTISIPNGVTTIGDAAFEDCENLTSIEIPYSVTRIESSAFMGCKGLKSVKLPKHLKVLDSKAFKKCSGLTEVRIPDNVSTLGINTFAGCSNLTTVYIGSGVNQVGDRPFEDCPKLKDIYYSAIKCPQMGIYSFRNMNFDKITLHVRPDVVDEFKGMIPWNNFKIVGDESLVKKSLVKNVLDYNTSKENLWCRIVSIENTGEETFLNFKFVSDKEFKCNISPEAYIEANGKKYTLIGSINIPYAPASTIYKKGTTEFTLVFPPIPADVKEFNFIEENSLWQFKNIKIQ